MGEASRIALKAIGKQDTHLLSKEPEDSFFHCNRKSHSEFRKYHRVHNVVNNVNIPGWPFGQTIKIEFRPQNMGDLLTNMWLSIKMPGVGAGEYPDQLGRHILKSITMFVDDIEVEKIHDDWSVIYDEMYLEMSEKIANNFLLNRNLGYDDSKIFTNVATLDSQLMIPIHFFFSRKYANDEYSSNQPNRPYFPLCAIHRQKIIFELEFHNQRFFTSNTNVIQLQSFNLITEEITVSPEERNYIANTKQVLVTDLVRKHPSIKSELGRDIILNNLVPNIPVKCIHWFFRNESFENDNDTTEFRNRFNFSSNSVFDEVDTFFYNVMDSASFYINGNKLPNVTNTNHAYYKYLIPFKHRLARPIRNIYTYSFSMNPINVEPSGNLDFSQIKSDKTNIEVKIKDTSKVYSMHMYYTGYQTFNFEGGFMSIAY
jgi:hypothetical protein